MHANLDRLLEARANRSLPEVVRQARRRIADERRAVDGLLLGTESGNPRAIYGFNTLLGQLDRISAGPEAQARLLDAHLIGRSTWISGGLLDEMTLVKIMQLSHGGSGISLATFDALLASAFSGRDGSGALWDSYGSGDVVPAAWWLVNVLGESAVHRFAPGDLIALLNGTFVSTAVAISALEDLIELGAELLARIASRSAHPVRDQRHPLVQALTTTDRSGSSLFVQAPVSARDSAPMIDAVSRGIGELACAIDRRLDRPSANPLFLWEDGRLKAHSQSGFLDVTLSMAFASSAVGLGFAASALQRMIEHTAAQGLRVDPQRMELVQPPKIAQAVLQEVLRLSGTSTLVAIGESNGIEDLADGSLAAGGDFVRMLKKVRELLPLDDLVTPSDRRVGAVKVGEIAAVLGSVARGRVRPTGHDELPEV